MTPSVQSQVMAAIVATINATAGKNNSGGPVAWRTRMTNFRADELPAINVLPEEGEVEPGDTNSSDRRFRFKVRHSAQAIDEVDAAVDVMYVASTKAILTDPKLGGLVMFTRELSQHWEMEKGKLDEVALVVLYECEFSTTRSDPSVSWP